LDAFLHITIGSRPVIARTRAAADQNKCFKDFGMIKTELKSNVAADADPRNDGFFYFFFAADAHYVPRHHGETRLRRGFVRMTVTPEIDGDHSEERRETGD